MFKIRILLYENKFSSFDSVYNVLRITVPHQVKFVSCTFDWEKQATHLYQGLFLKLSLLVLAFLITNSHAQEMQEVLLKFFFVFHAFGPK